MTTKERLIKLYNNGKVTKQDLCFGRIMPVGKYKGCYIFHLLVKHHRYMDWMVKEAKFGLTPIEIWWKNKIDTFIAIRKADNLIGGLAACGCDASDILPNIENPYHK